MSRTFRSGVTAERFVDTTLELIAEHGGSTGVNLRQIAKRIGCAHTNLYNYYADYSELLWEAFRRTLAVYADWLTNGLADERSPDEYLRRVLENLATFPQTHPGLDRFVASDPMPTTEIPDDILATVTRMKTWLADALAGVSTAAVADDEAQDIASIILAYVDGETLNLINDRLVPGEDVQGRIVANAMRLHRLLVDDSGPTVHRGTTLTRVPPTPPIDTQAHHQGG